MGHDDLIASLYRTAQTTHTNNLRRQTTRQVYAQTDSESRAFYVENALRDTVQELADEKQEHHLTRLAMRYLLSHHIALQKTLGRLRAKWAECDDTTPLIETLLSESDKLVEALLDMLQNHHMFTRDMEILRGAQRLGPKSARASATQP